MRPSAHVDIRTFVLTIAAWIKRFSIATKFSNLVKPVRGVLSDSLVAQYAEEQKGGISTHAYWASYSTYARFSLEPSAYTAVDTLLKIKSKEFRHHIEDLTTAIASCSLGESMFTWALPKAIDEHMEWFIGETLQYPVDRLLSADDILDFKRAIQVEGDRLFNPKV